MAKLIQEIEKDVSLQKYGFNTCPLLQELKTKLQNAKSEVCIERAVLMTNYLKAHEADPVPMQRAGAVRYYLANRKAQFLDKSKLAGNSTSKILGAPVYPEFLGLSIWPELETISTRKANPQQLSKADADTLNFDVYPFWMDKTILELTRAEKNPAQLKLMEMMVYFLNGKGSVISHTTPFYGDVLGKGINGIIREADAKIAALKGSSADDQILFYQSMQTALQGIIDYAQNLAKAAGVESKKTKDAKQKQNLLELQKICEKVPANPATTFREAANAILLCHIGVLAENVNMAINPGRLDQLLYPFFKNDFDKGILSIQDALEITGCLLLKIGDNTNLVPETSEQLFGGAGSVPAVTLGGVDSNGADAINDMTYILLRAVELLEIRDPNVNARYHPLNGEIYRKRVSEVIVNTKAIPAFYNDETCIDTLENQGVKTEDARDYAIIGCVELGSAGREYSSSSSILLNLTAAMDLALYNGRRPYITGDQLISFPSGDPAKFQNFGEFKDAFYKQLEWLLTQAIDLNEIFGHMYQKYLPTPLLSGLFQGPMETGKDLIFGGAKYNSSGVTHIGFADVTDSLNSIQYVLDNKTATLGEIVQAVQDDFSSKAEKEIQNKLKAAPKYGTEDSMAVQNSKELVQFLYEAYQARTNYRGGKYRPAFWTMTNHAGLGKIGGALPSGHNANTVFSSGITPSSQNTQSLTAAFNAVGMLDSRHIPGGYALNIKYSPLTSSTDKDKFVTQFSNLVAGYFMNKGMQVQFNIYSYDDLKKAKKNPEKYPNLLVRVSGYSAYFKDLNEAMQDELITRTQYDVFTQQAVPLT
jgi:formate C-acetyltransferase